MREQFEKLPEIAELVDQFDFSEDTNTYHIRYDDMDNDRKRLDVMYLGGAWYAFQEQQKKIEITTEYKDEVIKILNNDTVKKQKKVDDLNLKIQGLISKYESKTTLPILDQWSDCFVKSAKGTVIDLEDLLK